MAQPKREANTEKGDVNIIELRCREDLDMLYQKMEPLDNTIIILHHLDLLNGATDLRPAAIFCSTVQPQPAQQTDPATGSENAGIQPSW